MSDYEEFMTSIFKLMFWPMIMAFEVGAEIMQWIVETLSGRDD